MNGPNVTLNLLGGNDSYGTGVHTIFNNAKDSYTQALIACRPKLDDRPKRLPVIDDFVNGRAIETDLVMSNNFAFGGINTSLVLRRWRDG